MRLCVDETMNAVLELPIGAKCCQLFSIGANLLPYNWYNNLQTIGLNIFVCVYITIVWTCEHIGVAEMQN